MRMIGDDGDRRQKPAVADAALPDAIGAELSAPN
jgi:hypothetical protein